MPKNTITRLERWKIYIEIFGILVVSFGGGWSVFQHFDQLKKDKSDKLYSDLIIEGTIKYIEDLGKILDYQIGPATKESYNRENKLYNVLALIEDSDNLNKLKNKEIKVEIDPLTYEESQELGKRYAKVDDIMNMKMFFLGDEICEAIRSSARLISEERPHYQSNIIFILRYTIMI